MKKRKNANSQSRELQKMKERVAELEETLRAIRMGEVDALVVNGPHGEQVFTLQGAEHTYRVMMETIDEGAAILTEDGTVVYSNHSFAKFFNVPLEKFIGSPLQKMVPVADRQFLNALMKGAKIGATRGEIKLRNETERPRTIRLTLSPNHELGAEAICAIATELTEIVETNEALRVTETSLRQLSARLLQLQDEERRRIARDLHDTTGQRLVVLAMTLDRLARCADLRKSEAQEAWKESREITDKIAEEIRTLSYLLHPPLLDECGLHSAVRWYAEGFEKRSGIKLDVVIAADLVRLPIDAETALFRVVQESLTNVHRYSGSTRAEIRISEVSGEVRLEVIDFGKGLKTGTVRSKLGISSALGVGIPGMRERLHQLGGRLSVDFGTSGTTVTAILPIKMASKARTIGARLREEPVAAGSANGTFGNEAQQERRRILIVDDHELMRRGMRGLIESQEEWAICGEAAEGKEAIRKVQELKPDLVILDINMPGLSGLDAASRIRQENELTRILFFTVHDSEEVMKGIVDTGAQGYVAKSRAAEDLVDAVRDVLSGKTFFPAMAAAAGQT